MRRSALLIFFVFGLLSSAIAQQELGTYFMQNLWQSSLSNPARMTEKKVDIGLPGLYGNLINTAATFGDLVRVESDGRHVVDGDLVLAHLSDNNYMQAELEIQTTHLALKVKNVQFSFFHSIHFDSYFNYPSTLATFIFEGNGAYVGQTMPLGPDIQLNAYNEFAFGAAGKTGKLGWGGRIKYLTGIGNASSEKTKIDLYTDEDIYQLRLETDFFLRSSSYFRINELTNFDLDLGLFNYTSKDIFTQNSGLAIDLGLTYDFTEKLQLAASVTDLGKINWNRNVVNYSSQGTLSYEGIMIDDLLQNEAIPINSTLDSLDAIFDFNKTYESYSTTLPAKTYLGGTYQWNDRWQFGALLHNEFQAGTINTAVALSARARLSQLLTVGASYAYRHQRFDNLGLNVALKLGPLQIFGMTDNVLAPLQPTHNSNVRAGVNVVF